MPILSRRTVALAALCCLLAAPGFAVPGHAAGDNSNVMRALCACGLVILVRHGATFPDQAEIILSSSGEHRGPAQPQWEGQGIGQSFRRCLAPDRRSGRQGLYKLVQPCL